MGKKFKFYTKEQEEKIEMLRKQAEDERKAKLERERWQKSMMGINSDLDYVYVKIDGQTVSGKVLSKDGPLYEVSTPYGILNGLTRLELSHRHKDEIPQGVVIPDKFKQMSTKQLLSYFQGYRHWNWYEDGDVETYWQIKAELANRPHVSSKRERKAFEKFKKKK